MKKIFRERTLRELLSEVDDLFPVKRQKFSSYSFDLCRVKGGSWTFNVIDSWQKWMDKGLEIHFGLYTEPEYAVEAFLEYVRVNKIKVSKLVGN